MEWGQLTELITVTSQDLLRVKENSHANAAGNSPGTPPTQAPPLVSSWSSDVHDRKWHLPKHAGVRHHLWELRYLWELLWTVTRQRSPKSHQLSKVEVTWVTSAGTHLHTPKPFSGQIEGTAQLQATLPLLSDLVLRPQDHLLTPSGCQGRMPQSGSAGLWLCSIE